MHDVDHTRWKSSFNRAFCKHPCGERSHFAWFANDRTSCGECRRNFPSEEIERQIPWRDARSNSKCAVMDNRCCATMQKSFMIVHQDRIGKEANVRDRSWNIKRPCKGKRLSCVERFNSSKFVNVTFDKICESVQFLCTCRWWK